MSVLSSLLTPVGAVVWETAGAAGAVGRLEALVVSLSWEPVELPTRRILVDDDVEWPWPPFLSLPVGVSDLESS